MILKTVQKIKTNNICILQPRSTTQYLNPMKKSAQFKNKLTKGTNNYQVPKHSDIKTGQTHVRTQHIECNFQPKLLTKQEKSRSHKKFIEDQQNYQTIRQSKIKQFQIQITKAQVSSCTDRPEIDAVSKRICTLMNYCKEEVVQRLSKKKILDQQKNVQQLFSPKILPRSKSLKRVQNISELLHSDSIRRKQKKIFIQSNNEFLPPASPAINNNTNQLVCKKLYFQFCQIIPERQSIIPLVIVWTALSEIFGTQLNPNKSQKQRKLCQSICELLCQNGDESVSRTKLWEFIEIIVKKHNSKPIALINHVEKIIDRFGDLYTCRVTRPRSQIQPQESSFYPETLKSSQRKAQKHRSKVLETVKTYVENQNSKIKLNKEMTIQEMFLIDYQMKRSSLEKKKIQKQKQEMKKCTFKPKLSESYAKPVFMPPSANIGSSKCVSSKKAFNKSMSSQSLSMTQNYLCQSIKPITINNTGNASPAIKNIKTIPHSLLSSSEKSVMRMTIGRKNRELSNQLKNRGYSQKVQNWTAYAQTQKRQLQKEHKKYIGLTQKRVSLR